MKDRFTVGIISGVGAGIIASMVNLFLTQILHFGTLRYIDFSAIFIYGRKSTNLAEDLFAWIGYLTFTGILGIVFAYAIPRLTSQNFMLKSVFYGIMVWFFSYSITILFHIPILDRISLLSAISNLISAAVYGFVQGWVYRRVWKDRRIVS